MMKNVGRMGVAGIAVMALAFGALPAMGHAAEAPAAAAEPLWHKSCTLEAIGKQACVVEQFAVAMPQKKVVLHISFSLVPKADQVRMALVTPLGVTLGPGLALSVDGQKPITLPYERCTQQGCRVVAVLDKIATEQFVHGKVLVARYAVGDQESQSVPIKLQGLGEALKSLAP